MITDTFITVTLHQPVILILGFLLIKIEMADFARFHILIVSSFGVTCALYWFLIRPFSFTRLIFGMKPLQVSKKTMGMREEMELVPQLLVEKK